MNEQKTPELMYRCLQEDFIIMSPLDSRPIMACILKQLRLKLLTNPWDGLVSLNIERFSTMTHNVIELLHAKLPCNFGG